MAASGLRVVFLSAIIAWLFLLTGSSEEADNLQQSSVDPLTSFSIAKPLMLGSRRQRRFVQVVTALTKIGRCELADFQGYAGACSSLLYLHYRNNNSSKTCRTQLPTFQKCVAVLYDKCMSGEYSDSVIQQAKDMFAVIMQRPAQIKTICDLGGIAANSSSPLTSLCKSDFASKAAKCEIDFHNKYQANRGDPTLCEEYDKAFICVTTLMRSECTGSIIDVSLKLAGTLEKKSANPFCSPSQGGGNADAILAGKISLGSGSSMISASRFLINATGLLVAMVYFLSSWKTVRFP